MMMRKLFFLSLVLALFLLVVPASAQMSNDECLGCHSDPTATKDVGGGKTKSVHVDPAKFAGSIHGSFGCTDFEYAPTYDPAGC